MQIIDLNWVELPTFEELFKQGTHPDALSDLDNTGVYMRIYPKTLYDTEGVYIGRATSIYKRIIDHCQHIMMGNYRIPHNENTNFENPKYQKETGLLQFGDRERLASYVETVLLSPYLYALCSEEDMRAVEHVLISTAQKRAQTENYFLANRNIPSHNHYNGELKVTHSGAEKAAHILGQHNYLER